MLSENENTYLAKWLNNDLNHEEFEELKNLPEYDEYKKIVDGLEYFNAPSFDIKGSLENTLENLDKQPKKGKVIRLRPFIYAIAAAASIVLIIGLFFNTVTYVADSGQQLALELPDGSTVNLNAASSLTHQRFFWSQNRKVALDGEAFFSVTSGTNFSVTTTLGEIKVLGTQFNVQARSNRFQVGCYEGKVSVSSTGNQQKLLLKGDAVSLEDEKLVSSTITDTKPLWMSGESLFKSAPLGKVLDELERQYGVTIKREGIDQTKLFTGGFIYSDLTIALESVLVPMGIEYVVNGKNISLSIK